MATFIILLAVVVAFILFVFLALLSSAKAPKLDEDALNWNALADDELQSYLPGRKINAIKRYRDLTGADLKTAKQSIEYIIANPEALAKAKNKLTNAASRLADQAGDGVRDLIAEGKFDEAIRVYAQFMGVDQFTARDAIEQLQRD